MIPGKTYVGKLPGSNRKAFVRKRPTAVLVAETVTAPPPPVFATEVPAKMGMFSRSRRDGYYVSYGPSTPRAKYVCTRVPDVVYTSAPPSGRTATSIRQTCASCGRFRSAKWEAAHPLLPGMAASSSICAKCQHDHTSSEDREPRSRRYRKKKHYCRSRHCTDMTDDSYCSLRDRRSPRRYRSDSRDYSKPRSSPRDNVRIVIANQPGERPKPRSRRSSSFDSVRLVRRTSFVKVPERVRSRSRMRSSSRAYYLDDGTAQYVEDLRRPHYRSRSRSLSRASYFEDFEPAPRHKRRSSSRVQFVDDLEDPVLVPKPRRITRRRAIYFDGPASFEASDNEARGGPRSNSPQHEAEDHLNDDQLMENNCNSQYHSSSRTKEPNSDDELVEEGPASQQRLLSDSPTIAGVSYVSRHATAAEARHATGESAHARQSSDIAADDLYSDEDKTPRPAFHSLSASRTASYIRIPSGHKRTYSKSADSGYGDENGALRSDVDGSSPHPHPVGLYGAPARPQNKRRRTYRDDSTNDEHDPVGRISYRHDPARSISDPHAQTDYLSEMLKSSHITPPSKQANMASHWEPTRRPSSSSTSRSTSRSEGSVSHPHYFDDAAWDSTDQYSPVEDLYGNRIDGFTRAPAEDLYGNKLSDYGDGDAGGQYDWLY